MLEGFSQMRLRALQLPYIHEENPLTCPNLRGSDLLPSPPKGRPIEKTRQDMFSREHYSGNRRKWVTAFAPGSTSPCLEASCQGGGGHGTNGDAMGDPRDARAGGSRHERRCHSSTRGAGGLRVSPGRRRWGWWCPRCPAGWHAPPPAPAARPWRRRRHVGRTGDARQRRGAPRRLRPPTERPPRPSPPPGKRGFWVRRHNPPAAGALSPGARPSPYPVPGAAVPVPARSSGTDPAQPARWRPQGGCCSPTASRRGRCGTGREGGADWLPAPVYKEGAGGARISSAAIFCRA